MLHLVTNYALMYEPLWSKYQIKDNFENLQERQTEIEETLQRNLKRPMVASLHILINQEKARKRLRKIHLLNKHKLRIFQKISMPKFMDSLQ